MEPGKLEFVGSVLQGWFQVSLHQLVLFFKDGARYISLNSRFCSSSMEPGKLESAGSVLQGWFQVKFQNSKVHFLILGTEPFRQCDVRLDLLRLHTGPLYTA